MSLNLKEPLLDDVQFKEAIARWRTKRRRENFLRLATQSIVTTFILLLTSISSILRLFSEGYWDWTKNKESMKIFIVPKNI